MATKARKSSSRKRGKRGAAKKTARRARKGAAKKGGAAKRGAKRRGAAKRAGAKRGAVKRRAKSAPKRRRQSPVARAQRVAREVVQQAGVAVTSGVETLRDLGENLVDRVRNQGGG